MIRTNALLDSVTSSARPDLGSMRKPSRKIIEEKEKQR